MQLLIGGTGPLRRSASWRRPVASGATADRRKRPPGAPPLRREAAKKERTFSPAGYAAPGPKGDISILPREGTFLFCLDSRRRRCAE